MHKETKKAPEVPGLRVLDSPLDRSDFYPKAQISKRLSKKTGRCPKNDIHAGRPCWRLTDRPFVHVCRQNILDSWLGNLRECLAHLV